MRCSINLLSRYAETAQHVWIMPTRNALAAFSNVTVLPSNVRFVSQSIIEAEHRALLHRKSSHNPSREIADNYDIPSKRNLALKISREYGYEMVLLLDDDIEVTSQVILAMAQLRGLKTPIGGCCILDYPDVSTIEHIERYSTGYPSATMPGGNCMVINTSHISGFFPYLYNDDWFFAIWNTRQYPGIYFGDAAQTSHSPWHSLARVRFEEFGETLVTGIMGKTAAELQADLFVEDFWNEVLESRREYLSNLFSTTSTPEFRQAIATAINENRTYSPRQCCDAWKCLYLELEG